MRAWDILCEVVEVLRCDTELGTDGRAGSGVQWAVGQAVGLGATAALAKKAKG